MTTDQELAAMDARVSTLETGMRMIASGHAQLTEQLAEITVSQHRAEAQRKAQAQRLDNFDAALADNSRLTAETLAAARDIRDLITTARTGGRLVRWAAPTLAAAGATWATLKGWWPWHKG